MEVKDQLLRLVRLQDLILEIREARDVVEGAPGRLEEIEQRFRERNAEYVAVKERFEALGADQRMRTGELATLEEHKAKYMEDLTRVKNEREYAAMLKEIDTVKAQIAQHEEAIILDMEEIETVKGDLKSHEDHINEERRIVKKESADVEKAAQAAQKAIVKLEKEREVLESDLPKNLVTSILRLEHGRQGLFLSKADDGMCQSCFVRIRPQMFQEIKLAVKIHSCGNCKRLLFHEPSLTRLAGESRFEADAPDSGVAATNGPAVQ